MLSVGMIRVANYAGKVKSAVAQGWISASTVAAFVHDRPGNLATLIDPYPGEFQRVEFSQI
jgi:hypothetical protein